MKQLLGGQYFDIVLTKFTSYFFILFYPKQVYCAITKRVRKKCISLLTSSVLTCQATVVSPFFLPSLLCLQRRFFVTSRGTLCVFLCVSGGTLCIFFVFCGVWLLAPACGFFPPCLTRFHPFSIILAFTSILNGISWKRVTTDIFLFFSKKVAS